ncbi:serine/threonine-protein kinase mos [Ceratina calcarata]|uniref:non-specific serine/threonine protein kinase n=1 Tax=Ceratina calcarata TaxID=156304 RepID=A0AAJ7N3I4_9HYME|nr:serine/threonine-protein kinase mos [Ceratina calcarata]
MASPHKLVAKLRSLTPRILKNPDGRTYLSPYKQTVGNRNQFNIDTPNRRKILEDGLPNKHGTFLGSGGFGTVYKASYKGDEVAAKVMRTEKCLNVLNREKRASFLKHTNIVRVLMIEQGAALSLITMELCGTTLQDQLDERVLNKHERLRVLRGVTCALDFCHSAGIVHADVKPKNILLSVDGQPKLTDFGSSVLIEESNEVKEYRGTPGYTAPEIIKGNSPTPGSDIYSLGIVAWQMISRKLPFAGLHSHTIIYLSAKGHRPEDESIEDEVNGIYKSLYRKMWAQDVNERPSTNEIINRIDVLLDS